MNIKKWGKDEEAPRWLPWLNIINFIQMELEFDNTGCFKRSIRDS